MKSPAISILLLAAGASTRMGRVKQLLPWKGGTLLDDRIGTGLSSKASEVLVVLGAHSRLIADTVTRPPGCLFIVNADWQQGLGSSIGCGMAQLLNRPTPPEGVLLMLCDQPLITAEFLDQMIGRFNEGSEAIIATDYGTHAGVPALFGKAYFEKLIKLDRDTGAKDLLEEYAGDSLLLPLGPETQDMDVAEDYERLRKKHAGPDADG